MDFDDYKALAFGKTPDFDETSKNPQIHSEAVQMATFRADNQAVFAFAFDQMTAWSQSAGRVEAIFENYGVVIRGKDLEKTRQALLENTLVMVKGKESPTNSSKEPELDNHYSVEVVDMRDPTKPLQSLIPRS